MQKKKKKKAHKQSTNSTSASMANNTSASACVSSACLRAVASFVPLRNEMRPDRISEYVYCSPPNINMKFCERIRKRKTRRITHIARPRVASKQGNLATARPSLFFVCIHTAIPPCTLSHLYSEQSFAVSALPVSLSLHRQRMPSRYHFQVPTTLPYLRLHRHLVNAPAIKYHHR